MGHRCVAAPAIRDGLPVAMMMPTVHRSATDREKECHLANIRNKINVYVLHIPSSNIIAPVRAWDRASWPDRVGLSSSTTTSAIHNKNFAAPITSRHHRSTLSPPSSGNDSSSAERSQMSPPCSLIYGPKGGNRPNNLLADAARRLSFFAAPQSRLSSSFVPPPLAGREINRYGFLCWRQRQRANVIASREDVRVRSTVRILWLGKHEPRDYVIDILYFLFLESMQHTPSLHSVNVLFDR